MKNPGLSARQCFHPPFCYIYLPITGGVRVVCGECEGELYRLIQGRQLYDTGPPTGEVASRPSCTVLEGGR